MSKARSKHSPARRQTVNKAKEVAKSYEPTAEEARGKVQKPTPRMRAKPGKDALIVEVDHPSPETAVMEVLGTTDREFLDGLLGQLLNVATKGQKPDYKGFDYMLAMVRGIAPQDETEALLAAQMAAIHNATMTMARRLNHVENIPQQDSAERALNKLARTFAAQVDSLKRYRSTGEQKMTVEHVTVNQGGQAIVGQVSHRGRGANKKTEPTS